MAHLDRRVVAGVESMRGEPPISLISMHVDVVYRATNHTDCFACFAISINRCFICSLERIFLIGSEILILFISLLNFLEDKGNVEVLLKDGSFW